MSLDLTGMIPPDSRDMDHGSMSRQAQQQITDLLRKIIDEMNDDRKPPNHYYIKTRMSEGKGVSIVGRNTYVFSFGAILIIAFIACILFGIIIKTKNKRTALTVRNHIPDI